MSRGISKIIKKSDYVELVNRFNLLQHEGNGEHEKAFDTVDVNPTHTVVP